MAHEKVTLFGIGRLGICTALCRELCTPNPSNFFLSRSDPFNAPPLVARDWIAPRAVRLYAPRAGTNLQLPHKSATSQHGAAILMLPVLPPSAHAIIATSHST
jgi:hypothetical protein